jgi:TetR/AcrR family transcriptional regulator
MNNVDRKQQIIDATLFLLADSRVDQVTTRKIAKHIGLSQPALFRHFRSRESLLIAVVDHAREQLGLSAEAVLRLPLGPIERLRRLIKGLVLFIEEHPGLPRVLFFDAAQSEGDGLRTRVRQLIAMHIALVATVVEAAIEAGEIKDRVDPSPAGRFLVATIQGVVLHWQLNGREERFSPQVDNIIDTWLGGIEQGCVKTVQRVSTPNANPPEKTGIGILDVRPILERGQDPLNDILAASRLVSSDGVLVLTVPFRPSPLIALFEGRGHRVSIRSSASGLTEVWVFGLQAPTLLDVSELPSPEPIEAVLLAVAESRSTILAHTPRLPALLLERLGTMGLTFKAHRCNDETGLVYIEGASL